jgi:hypothetical protein
MTIKICYWDEVEKLQKERDMTSAEEAEINALRAAPLSLAAKKASKLQALADYRFNKETGGITLAGQHVETDRSTVAQLTSAWALVQVDPSATIDWKRPNGWITHSRVSLNAVLVGIGAHIRACFAREKFHAEQIAALNTGPQVDAYDFTTGWPS